MGYDVDIQPLEISAVIDLQGNADAIADWIGDALPRFPEQANTASEKNGLSLYWIGPDRWLLRADLERETELLELTRPADAPVDLSIVQISDTIQFFAITGNEAGEIISIASSIDHHPTVFPGNGVTYTDVFGIKGLLVRRVDGFDIGVERSYGDMIEDFLARANA